LLTACAALAFTSLAGAAAAATDTATDAAAASAAPEGSSLTAVVVTARKRSEDVQRVPLVVQNFTARQLVQQGIRSPMDLGRFVPGLVSVPVSNKSGVQFVVRGQSASDTTLQVGTPVGVYEDGVNIPHPGGFDGTFFDIANVQVLKGPQGTLYGRNTTGGALLITTRDADYRGFHGFVGGEVGNDKDWKLEGAANLPIIPDMLAVRVAVQHWGRQGFGRSAVTGQYMGGDHDDTIVRGTIRFDPTPTISSVTKIEYSYLNRANAMTQARAVNNGGIVCNPAFAGAHTTGETTANGVPATCAPGSVSAPILAQLTTGLYSATFEPAEYTITPNALFGGLQGTLNAQFGPGVYNVANLVGNNLFLNYVSHPVSEKLKIFHVAETLNVQFGSIATLKSITGYHYFQDFDAYDISGLPGNLIGTGNPIITSAGVTAPLPQSLSGPDQSDGQLTQEFNLSGAWNNLKWLVGAFGSRDMGANEQWAGAVGSLGFNTFNAYLTPSYRNTTLAVFTQEDYRFTNWFSVTAGLRYTEEKVSQLAMQVLYTPSNPVASQYSCATANSPQAIAKLVSSTPYACAIPSTFTANINTVANPVNVPTTHAESRGLSYLFSLNFQLTPTQLLYLRTAKGFHGAVVQNRAFTGAPASPETAVDYEIGYKAEFFQHRFRMNLAVFDTHYANKQEQVLSGSPPITIVFNATTANIRGFEGEFAVVPAPGLTLNATVGYTWTQYGHFIASNPIGKGFIDASGTAFPSVRPWTYSLGGRYEHEAGPGILSAALAWSWASALPITPFSLDPLIPLSILKDWKAPVGLLSGQIEYALPQHGLTISIFATNLLDKHYQFAGTASETDGSVYGVTQEPRMFGIRIRKAFGPGES